jgi:hypothetical protein
MARINLARCTAGQKGKKRSQTFTAPADGISHVAFDRRIERCRLLRNAAFNFVKMRLDKPCHLSQGAVRKSGSGNASPARSRACKDFHTRRIEGRLACCQSNTRAKFWRAQAASLLFQSGSDLRQHVEDTQRRCNQFCVAYFCSAIFSARSSKDLSNDSSLRTFDNSLAKRSARPFPRSTR